MEDFLVVLLSGLIWSFQIFFTLGGPAAALGYMAGSAIARTHKYTCAAVGAAIGLALWHGTWWWVFGRLTALD